MEEMRLAKRTGIEDGKDGARTRLSSHLAVHKWVFVIDEGQELSYGSHRRCYLSAGQGVTPNPHPQQRI
jgi:hypothetical protein